MTSSPAAGSAPAAQPGTVYLVGGGPGDPDLLTVRAWRLLDEADVVVHDRLGPVSILADLDAELIDVGKSPWHHAVPQERINETLIEQALVGRKVVRLKGGDPFVLGRGGEEWLACAEAGVPCEVVPGVTSAVAAPAAAGIPVTHRGWRPGCSPSAATTTSTCRCSPPGRIRLWFSWECHDWTSSPPG